jgi:hypothetical protein
MVSGDEVKGEFSSADATTAAVATLYNAQGVARPLTTGDRLVITDIFGVAASAAGLVVLFSDNDADGVIDAGERLFPFSGSSSAQLTTELYCKAGITPKVKAAAAGQVDLVFTGVIIRS